MNYPASHVPAGGGVYNPVASVQAVYGRNALAQPNSLAVGGQSVVTSAYYNTAGQLQQLNWDGWTEDRWYNTAGQMWKQQIKAGSTVIGGWEYYFPVQYNNGRITGTKDLQSLEEITYQYDSLNRLVNATKTGGGWAETYVYDGFGNLTTKGASTWLVDTATNRLHASTGATYDNNGNLTGLSGGVSFTHDTANRVTTANPTGEQYRYTTDNRRIYKYRPGWGEEITFWGPTGRLATYRIDTVSNGTMYFVEQTRNVWFGTRLLRTGPAATPTKLATDRLGSIRLRQTGANPIEYLTYAPYGEQRSGPAGEGEKFATYYRDQTGLDYADQRFFNTPWGRFATVDQGPMLHANPASFNRYAYAWGDPANLGDGDGRMPGRVVIDPGPGGAEDPRPGCVPGAAFFLQSWFRTFPVPDTGTVGFDPREYYKARQNLKKAADKALEALEKPDCLAIFLPPDGGDLNDPVTGRTLDPAIVLKSLVNAANERGDRGYGAIWVGEMDYTVVATTIGAEPSLSLSGPYYGKVKISLNSDYLNMGYVSSNTTSLLHELGHALNKLSAGVGSQNSFLEFDAFGDRSYTNTKLVEDKCTRNLRY